MSAATVSQLSRTHRATASQPQGRLELPSCRAVTSVSARPQVDHTPTKAQRAWLCLASDVIAGVLSSGPHIRRDSLPGLVRTNVSARAKRAYRDGLVRRGVVLAGGAATLYASYWQPADLYFVGAEVTDALHGEDPFEGELLTQRRPIGARLAWSSGDGSDVLLDRLTHTHLGTLVRSPWMNPQIAADLRLGAALAPESFRGVRIFAPQAFASSLHVLPDGSDHRLDGCEFCARGGVWV